jgi:hypothetical protein
VRNDTHQIVATFKPVSTILVSATPKWLWSIGVGAEVRGAQEFCYNIWMPLLKIASIWADGLETARDL